MWIKDVKPDDKSVAYEDVNEGDIFYLHWPNISDKQIESFGVNELILLKQYRQITHVVMPISSEIKKNNDLIYGKKYPKCREVRCIKRTLVSVSDLFGKESEDRGSGRRIQVSLHLSDSEFNDWQNKAIDILQLDKAVDLSSDNQWNEYSKEEFAEGRQYYKYHNIRERNRTVINEKKRSFKYKHDDKLFCEICEFCYERYGEIGNDFIEVHHLLPLAEAKKETTTSVDDLICVCSNCHRMIHRLKPMKYNLDDLKAVIKLRNF